MLTLTLNWHPKASLKALLCKNHARTGKPCKRKPEVFDDCETIHMQCNLCFFLSLSRITTRGSMPPLEANEVVLDIPSTPQGDLPNAIGSILPLTILTALIIGSWYLSNIGALLLNKYLLSICGYCFPSSSPCYHLRNAIGDQCILSVDIEHQGQKFEFTNMQINVARDTEQQGKVVEFVNMQTGGLSIFSLLRRQRKKMHGWNNLNL